MRWPGTWHDDPRCPYTHLQAQMLLLSTLVMIDPPVDDQGWVPGVLTGSHDDLPTLEVSWWGPEEDNGFLIEDVMIKCRLTGGAWWSIEDLLRVTHQCQTLDYLARKTSPQNRFNCCRVASEAIAASYTHHCMNFAWTQPNLIQGVERSDAEEDQIRPTPGRVGLLDNLDPDSIE